MVSRLSLSKLFGDFSAAWPRDFIQPDPGIDPTSPEFRNWLERVGEAVLLSEVRTAASGSTFAVEAKLALKTQDPNGLPFVLAALPDIVFRLLSVPKEKGPRLYLSQDETGVHALVEGLPVEIELPPGFVSPHPDAAGDPAVSGEVSVGKFKAGDLDTQEIVYRAEGGSLVRAHLRIEVDREGKVALTPVVPLSFGACRFLDVPCLAVHDLQLIPDPAGAKERLDWLRHTLSPWAGQAPTPVTGFFAARSIHLDPAHPPTKDVATWMAGSTTRVPNVAFILDDVAVPFYSTYAVPIPRHVTVGIRREVIDPSAAKAVYAFEKAPITLTLSKDPVVNLIVESLFFRSPSSEDIGRGEFGLTFSAMIAFGEKQATMKDPGPGAKHAITFGLGENATPRLGYRRNFDLPDELLNPVGDGSALYQLLHYEIGDVRIDLIGGAIGYSLGRAIGEDAGFAACAELLVDLFVQVPPTGGDGAFFHMRALDGQKVAFAIQGIGWKQGSFHLAGVAMPDGVAIYFGPVALVVQEIGLVADAAATYLSISGGLVIAPPGGFSGGVLLKRARFKLQGSTGAPAFKLDGIFARFTAPILEIEAGGYFSDTLVDGTRVEEFGFTGSLMLKLPAVKFGFSLDLIIGSLKSPSASFKYFMFQLVVNGAIPVYAFELRSIRVLFARNMVPKLAAFDAQSGDMRYFNWYRANDPLTVPGDRRLAAWQPSDNAISAGLGCGVGITGLSVLVQLRGFLLVVISDPEDGALFALELLLGTSRDPVAYAAIELDVKNDRYSLLLGVDLTLKQFVSSVPKWLEKVAKLTGTAFLTNKPATFAIGRISDTRTWLSVIFDLDLFVFKTFFQLGVCIEIVEGGPKGVGVVLKVEGGIQAGVVRITYFAGLGVVISSFQTGSADFALSAFIEAGLRVVLFGFLRFGLGVRAELRQVGYRPSLTELSILLRFETPWFLPDVSFKIEHVSGRLAPAELATAASPLRGAAAHQPLVDKTVPTHVERFDSDWDGEGPNRTHSVAELRGGSAPEGARLTNFANDDAVSPVATDATIALDFTVALGDRLALDASVGDFGTQSAENLELRYELVGWKIRRRPRFVPGAPWTVVDQAVPLAVDFSDPDNIALTGTIGGQVVTLFWDQDVRIEGRTAAKRLLVNSATPFSFATVNPEADEQQLAANPNWPCCPPPQRDGYERLLHRIDFRDDVPGSTIRPGRRFSRSRSLFTPLRPAFARPRSVDPFGSGGVVAAFDRLGVGPLFRADLDEDAVLCVVWVAWAGVAGNLELAAFDAHGKLVGTRTEPFAGIDERNLTLTGQAPIRRFELRLIAPVQEGWRQAFDPPAPHRNRWQNTIGPHQFQTRGRQTVEVSRAGYIGLADFVAAQSAEQRCRAAPGDFAVAYEGKGKLFFLPNHDYEIEVATTVTTKHATSGPEAATLSEYAYFATKGLPGLNATAQVGLELEPYVTRAYTGTGGLIYREEPVTLAFKEGFHVAVPLPLRPPGSSAERTQLFRMALTTRPNTASPGPSGSGAASYSTTTPDWIVAHRAFSPLPLVEEAAWQVWVGHSELLAPDILSRDPGLLRLAGLTQREDAQCPLGDPRKVVGPVLAAYPQGPADPADPGTPLWPASTGYTATVRPQGSGFIDRPRFVGADKTAMRFALDAVATDGASWQVIDGQMRIDSGALRRFAMFGEPSWNHVSARLALTLSSGMAGFAVALPTADTPQRGLFAVAERVPAGTQLALYRRLVGTEMVAIAQQFLPDAGTDALVLLIDAFDDRLRLSCGDVRIEAARGALREGRVGLIAQGSVSFRSLEVVGLPLYAFPFGVSRYRNFESHIGSFGGRTDILAPDAMGAGTTSATVATLLSQTFAEIGSVMQPEEPDAARAALFQRWVDALALPSRQEPQGLVLSAFVENAATTALLMETPEPLNFAGEVTLKAERRVPTITPRPPWLDSLVHRLAEHGFGRALRPSSADRQNSTVLAAIGRSLEERGPTVMPVAKARPRLTAAMRRASEIRVDLDPAHPLGRGRPSMILRVEAAGGKATLGVFDARAGRKAEGQSFVKGRLQREVTVSPSMLGTVDTSSLNGMVIILDPTTDTIIDWHMPPVSYMPISTTVLQDGSATRALVLAHNGGVSLPWPSGTYRLTLSIARKRFEAVDPSTPLAVYARTGSLYIKL